MTVPLSGTPEPRVPCPWCAERILPEAVICRFCGRDVDLRHYLNGPRGGDVVVVFDAGDGRAANAAALTSFLEEWFDYGQTVADLPRSEIHSAVAEVAQGHPLELSGLHAEDADEIIERLGLWGFAWTHEPAEPAEPDPEPPPLPPPSPTAAPAAPVPAAVAMTGLAEAGWGDDGWASTGPPLTPRPPHTVGAATASLVLGLLSWFLLPLVGAVAAIVLGHSARSTIRRSEGTMSGTGLATAGLVLGYLNAAVVGAVLLVTFAVGDVSDNSQDAACRIELRTVQTAAEAYRSEYGSYPADQDGLVPDYLERSPIFYGFTSDGSSISFTNLTDTCPPPDE